MVCGIELLAGVENMGHVQWSAAVNSALWR